MSYSITPMTEEELNAYDLIEEGIYDFAVLKSERQISKSGNPMARLQLNVWDKNGKSTVIFDYLVFSNIKLCVRKVRHFCRATEIIEDFEKGIIREELEGLCGKVNIGIKESLPNPAGGYYPSKNVVIDYITKDNASKSNEKKIEEDPFPGEDIPF